jgi:hypothetical protein
MTDRVPRLALLALLAAISVTVTTFGIAAGLSTQVTRGVPETGQGAFVAEQPLAYWAWHATQLGTIPVRVPARASVAVNTPTLLPRGGRSYTINAGVAGQTSVAWTFDETVGAPRSTELVITFVDGLTQPTSTIIVYVETNARAPGFPAAYVFYWDAGAFAPGALAIETLSATVQACSAIGTCP